MKEFLTDFMCFMPKKLIYFVGETTVHPLSTAAASQLPYGNTSKNSRIVQILKTEIRHGDTYYHAISLLRGGQFFRRHLGGGHPSNWVTQNPILANNTEIKRVWYHYLGNHVRGIRK